MNLPLEMNKKGAIWSRARKGPALEKNFFGLAYLDRSSPIGPALAKFVQATALFTKTGLPAPLAEKLTTNLDVQLTRFIFASVMLAALQGKEDSLGIYIRALLRIRPMGDGA